MISGSETLRSILRAGGIGQGGILLVHASFRRLGQQGLSPESAIDIILDFIGKDGTLLMPAMSWRTVIPEWPVFNELETAGHVGILSETFRVRYASFRSLHPTHSVVGLGPMAEFLLCTHHMGCTPVPLASPYGKMRGRGAQILMLDTGLETATVFHHPEEMVAPWVYLRDWAEIEGYILIDRYGRRHSFQLLRHKRIIRDFEKFRAPLKERGALADGYVSEVRWTAFNVDRTIAFVSSRLIQNPNATLADG